MIIPNGIEVPAYVQREEVERSWSLSREKESA